jgi:hypothetical protein
VAKSGGDARKSIGPIQREMELRFLACAAGLPRVCLLRKCRRSKRCFGNLGTERACELPCLRHHSGLVRARYRAALALLGWCGPALNRERDGAEERERKAGK